MTNPRDGSDDPVPSGPAGENAAESYVGPSAGPNADPRIPARDGPLAPGAEEATRPVVVGAAQAPPPVTAGGVRLEAPAAALAVQQERPPNPNTANPMLSGLGPAAYADRADVPDLTAEGAPKVVPMRTVPNFFVEPRDPDPRGMAVVGADGAEAGVVTDLWVDRSEPQLRYLEVQVGRGGVGGRTVLLPVTMARVNPRAGRVKVTSILAEHFADVPATAHPDRVTLLEEDKIMAYFAAGHMYATPRRRGPLL